MKPLSSHDVKLSKGEQPKNDPKREIKCPITHHTIGYWLGAFTTPKEETK